MTVRIRIRNSALTAVAEAEEFFSLALVLRHNDASSWALTLPADSDAALALTFAGGIVVTRNGQPLLSGPVLSMTREYANDRTVLTAAGVDDTGLLAARLALPVPAGAPFTTQDYDDKSGKAETVLRYYVDRNLGPSAPTGRRVTDVALLTDQARGASVRGRARFVNLLELAQSLALAGGVGFRLRQNGLARELQVFEPADRTASAIFSPQLGNLAGYTYGTTAPTSNHTYVGGQGEGVARTIIERTDAASIAAFGRRETFRDRRDTDVVDDLTQAGDEELAEKAATSTLSLVPLDTDAVAYGTTYNVGDRVTVVVDGVVLTDIVQQVQLAYGPSGESIVPVVGSAGAALPGLDLISKFRQLARRTGSLERR